MNWAFEIAIGGVGETSLRSLERCSSFEKFGSEITCCLRAPLMERTFDMKSQEHDSCILYYRKGIQENQLFKCHHILHFFIISTNALALCFPLFVYPIQLISLVCSSTYTVYIYGIYLNFPPKYTFASPWGQSLPLPATANHFNASSRFVLHIAFNFFQ